MKYEDLFCGMNYVNTNFIVEAETVTQLKSSNKLHPLRRYILIAALVATLLMLIGCGAACRMEAKTLMLVRHKKGGPITLILLQFRKGGKPGLQIHEQCLFNAHGDPTDYYREVYHIQGD